ncbi:MULTISPECIES: DUF2141 domain-containing protein [unclassified Novosphingobium]|uniref:DUF2141 domain-containing protein n=1 Tax=unclassified Novosphingobium TaxID=2644732 RepID=UPI0025FF42DE|nr:MULTISPECIES: DUF2141 domain-containing protein [unclassified Novosphingobium]HQV02330.1 DUF2141 domain-containing protein [Novosphingobium sp.]
MKFGLARTWLALAAVGLTLSASQTAGAQGGAPAGCTGAPSATWVNLTIEGLRNSNGVVTIAPYPDNPAVFLKPRGSLANGRVKARAGMVQACIFLPEPGAYGLALYHDENANGKVDKNGLGIPKEGFGFSNNPRIFFSAPSFKKVRVVVSGPGASLRIRMKYP